MQPGDSRAETARVAAGCCGFAGRGLALRMLTWHMLGKRMRVRIPERLLR
jgi:hypothetical protein